MMDSGIRTGAASLGERAWKAALVLFALFALAYDLTALWRADLALADGRAGTLGVELVEASGRELAVKSLTADSPLAAAGVAVGDHLRFDWATDKSRLLPVDRPVGLTVMGQTGTRHLEVRPAPDRDPIDAWTRANTIVCWVVSGLIFAVGLMVGWRRADSPMMRALAASMLSQVLYFFTPLVPQPLHTFGRAVWPELSLFAAYVGFTYFVLVYTDAQAWRRPLGRWAFRAFVATYAVDSLRGMAFRFVKLPHMLEVNFSETGFILHMASAAFCIGALIHGWRKASGERKQRLAWIALCMGTFYAVAFGGNLVGLIAPNAGISWEAFFLFLHLTVMAAYAGLGYAVLRHRILDFGFAVNRTMVYGITSLLLAAAFMLASQLVNRVIQFEGRHDSRIVDIAIGLMLALGARQAVRWVDPRVQRIFFRRWHMAAAKLASIQGSEVERMEAGELRRELLHAVQAYANVAGVALYQVNDRGELIQACATLEGLPATLPVVLPPRDLPVPVSTAIAVKVRGELVGALLLGARPDDEALRPDEVRAITTAAQHVALELELRRLKDLETSRVKNARGPRKLRRKSGQPG